MKLGAPLWVIIPASIAVTLRLERCGAASAAVTGPYLAMVALAFGTIIQILINEMTSPKARSASPSEPSVRPQAQRARVLLAHVRTDGDLSGGGSRILKSQLGRAFEALRQPGGV
jgi:branched-chain amino acid transport system permease protein